MADTETDIKSLIRAEGGRPDGVAIAHVLASTLFLALGAAAAGVAILSMSFPAFIPLGYGIFRPIAMAALMIGFGVVSVVGGSYYVLPRLTGAPLWNGPLAQLGLALIAGSTIAGVVVVGLGFGDGREPFGFPWWLDLPLLAGLAIPPLVAIQTVRGRTETYTFITIPYILCALGAFPLLYVAGNLPATTSVSSVIGDLFYTSAHLVALVIAAAGLAFYAIVRQGDHPLAGRQLASVGLWSLLFGMGWFGIAQTAGGPYPTWLGAIAGVLGLALPVGAMAVAAAVISTVHGAWRRSGGGPDPVVATAVAGTGLALVVTVMAAAAGFGNSSTLLALTPYWEGVTYALLLGVLPLLIASWTFQALPRMMGRLLYSSDSARRFIKLTLFGAGGLLVTMTVAGLVMGYTWAGSSFLGAFTAVGAEWSTVAALANVFVGFAGLAGGVAAIANLSLASLLFRSITQGEATAQEILVTQRGGVGGS
ncbi:hypothetical protein BH23ACT5_BH23ACT5_17880 [soil metagenome]